jgi:hypothetical protein
MKRARAFRQAALNDPRWGLGGAAEFKGIGGKQYGLKIDG